MLTTPGFAIGKMEMLDTDYLMVYMDHQGIEGAPMPELRMV